jgi:flagellar biogenesis protein FliO
MNALNFLAVVMEDMFKSLEIMWKGVVAIFIVIGLVIVATNLVNKFFVKREEAKQQNDDATDNQ